MDLEEIFARSKNVKRNSGEGSIEFFTRITEISRLASFNLDVSAREQFMFENIREQFIRNSSRKFNENIKQRELATGSKYSPPELFQMYTTFERLEKSEVNLNKFESCTDAKLCQAFKVKKKQKNRGRSSTKDKPTKEHTFKEFENIASKNRQDRSRSKGQKQKNQVRKIHFNENKQGKQTKPMTSESIAKRRQLQSSGPGIVCFLCGGPHISPKCKVYPNVKATDTPCRCKFFHPPEMCKTQKSRPNPTNNENGRAVVVRN
jgi:hypothetical protein